MFKGLRDDLKTPAHATRRPTAVVPRGRSIHGVPRENILQLLPDAVTPSKEQLTAYWRKVAKQALKHLARRPLKLVRHTHGITFYHMGPLPEIPDSVHQLRIEKREGGEGVRLWIDDLAGLVGLVSMGVVELHPWAATVDAIEHPDRIVLDLDPGQGVEWQFVVKSALRLREMLEGDEGLACWPKLTGGKGVHVMIPITSGMTHDDARRYGRDLAQRLAATAPTRYTTSAAPSRRGGRIYIDYLRNGRGTTAVGAYSPRARSGFPIAAPVSWRELEGGTHPDAFTIEHPFRT